MKATVIYIILFYFLALFLSRCVLCRIRWSDRKAYRIFAEHHVPLKIYDTVIGGHHIHYAITGDDSLPSLVFIHGSPGSWYRFVRMMWEPELLKKFRMVSIDRPGYGYSSFGHVLSLDEQSNLIWPVLRKIKMGKPMILLGHSLGGAVVSRIAAEDPSFFKRLIILSGAIDPVLEPRDSWRKLVNIKPIYWLIPGAFQSSNTEILGFRKELELLAGKLDKITCNVSFIHGDADTWVPIGNVDYGIKMMKNAASITTDTIHGSQHRLARTQPGELTKIILRLEE